MDTETINNHLNKLEEFINDEDKIVTVPWLCSSLNINPKESKLLLEKSVLNNRKAKPGSLAVTYILSGLHNNLPLISIVKEDELDDKKELYGSEPVVEIYSVQKFKDIDFNTISLVDNFDIHDPKETPIKGSAVSKNCLKRQLKVKAIPIQTTSNVKEKEKPSLFAKVPPKTSKLTEPVNTSSPKSSVKTTKAAKGNSFAQYFTKGENKNAESIKTEKAPLQNNIKQEEKIVSPKTEIKNNLQNLVDSDNDDEEEMVQPSQRVVKNKNAKRKSTKKDTPSSKRRKRIVVEEESDDDIFGNDEEEDEDTSRKRKNIILDSEDDEPIIKPEPVLAPKNKKRKLVDKTFEDDEGYVITRKEWVEESGSDVEVTETPLVKMDTELKKEAKVEKEIEPEPTKKDTKESGNKLNRSNSDLSKNDKVVNGKVQAGKGKKAVPVNQPTLMNFFKRK